MSNVRHLHTVMEAETDEEVPPELRRLPVNFLDCRDLRHAWRRLGSVWGPYDPVGYRELHRQLQCIRCDTVRTDVYSYPRYERIRSHYDYPENYQIPTGEASHGVKYEHVRAEVFRRLTPPKEEAAAQ